MNCYLFFFPTFWSYLNKELNAVEVTRHWFHCNFKTLNLLHSYISHPIWCVTKTVHSSAAAPGLLTHILQATVVQLSKKSPIPVLTLKQQWWRQPIETSCYSSPSLVIFPFLLYKCYIFIVPVVIQISTMWDCERLFNLYPILLFSTSGRRTSLLSICELSFLM